MSESILGDWFSEQLMCEVVEVCKAIEMHSRNIGELRYLSKKY